MACTASRQCTHSQRGKCFPSTPYHKESFGLVDFTLPSLQGFLDRMTPDESVALAKPDIERLFGLNGVAVARINRFARGHRCDVNFTDGCVIFVKLPGADQEI